MSAAAPPPPDWPAGELERLGACPVCGGTDRRLLYEGMTDVGVGCAPGTWTLWRCAGCSCAYLDPRPSTASIGIAYRRYFTHAAAAPSAPPRSGWHQWRHWRLALGNGYRNHLLRSRLRPSLGPLGVLAAWLSPRQREDLRNELMGLAPLPERGAGEDLGVGRMLDIGCGNGDLLLRARRIGWDVAGVEPDPEAAAAAARGGIAVIGRGVDDVDPVRAGCFDRITLSHVIEHVHDPRHLLQRCRPLLRPRGTLWLETPNIDSVGHAEFGRNWRQLDAPRHLVLFSRETLRRLVADAGFPHVRFLPPRGIEPISFRDSLHIAEGRCPLVDPMPALDAAAQAGLSRRLAQVRAEIARTPERADYMTLEAQP